MIADWLAGWLDPEAFADIARDLAVAVAYGVFAALIANWLRERSERRRSAGLLTEANRSADQAIVTFLKMGRDILRWEQGSLPADGAAVAYDRHRQSVSDEIATFRSQTGAISGGLSRRAFDSAVSVQRGLRFLEQHAAAPLNVSDQPARQFEVWLDALEKGSEFLMPRSSGFGERSPLHRRRRMALAVMGESKGGLRLTPFEEQDLEQIRSALWGGRQMDRAAIRALLERRVSPAG